MRILVRWLLLMLYRFRAYNVSALDTPGPVLLLPNHVSWWDWLLIGVCLENDWRFVTSSTAAELSWAHRRIMINCRTIPVDIDSPFAVKRMAEYLQHGGRLVLFPEGRLSCTGSLMQLFDGTGFLIFKTRAKVITAYIRGAERLPFSRAPGRKQWFPRLSVHFSGVLNPPGVEHVSVTAARARLTDWLRDQMVRQRLETERAFGPGARLSPAAAAPTMMEMNEKLQMRVHGDASQPTLIYLPGLHGDWTLVGSFRHALGGRVRFIETTYPRTLTWSLEDYAGGVETALAERGIVRGWLLGESFSSQVVWSLVARERFQIEGVILAGGFVRHPMRWGVRLAERLCGGISLTLLTRILFGYAKVARFRYRRAPEVLANINEFIARRTELDRQAATHRLRLIAQNDPRPIARRVKVPVYALSGLVDPVVPWCCVRPWLKKNCPNLREYKIIGRADHNVLGTGAQPATDLVLRWISRDSSRQPQMNTDGHR